MSGSGKPGATFQATVVSNEDQIVEIEGEAEDLEYLVPGRRYLFNVTPVGAGHRGGGNDTTSA